MYPTISSSKIKHFAGFTLVELIVVITILVILGTVAFTSLGGYSSSARDSSRVSDLTNLKKGLDVFLVKSGIVPPPDANTVTITASGTPIGYQGYAGANMLGMIKMSNAQDPLDKKYYTYLTNASYMKYQIFGLLENNNIPVANLSLFIESASAEYEIRYPLLQGDRLGIFLSNTGTTPNQPVQEFYNPVSFTGIDVVNTSTGYIVLLSNTSTDQLNGTGLIITQAVDTLAPSMNYPFTKTFGGSNAVTVQRIFSDNKGYIYVVGNYINNMSNISTITDFAGNTLSGVSNTTSDDIFIAKLNSFGQQIWIKTMWGSGSDSGLNLATDSDNNVYIVGRYANNSSDSNTVKDFVGNPLIGLSGTSGNDGFIAKLSGNNGSQVWIKTIGGAGADIIRSVILDSNNNIYVGGSYNNNSLNTNNVINFSGTSLLGVSGGNSNDGYIAKLSGSDGSQTWIKTIGGLSIDSVLSVSIDLNDNVYVVWSYSNSLTIDFAGNSLPGSSGLDGYIAKLSGLDGSQTWIKTIGGSNPDIVSSVSIDIRGDIYIGGYYTNSTGNANNVKDFAGTWLFGVSGANSNDGYVAKLSGSDGSQTWIKTIGGSGSDIISSITVDSNGGVYVGGWYVNTSSNTNNVKNFAGTSLLGVSGTNSNDGYIAKLSGIEGSQTWIKRMGGGWIDGVSNIYVDNNNNVYVAWTYTNYVTNGWAAKDFINNPLYGISFDKTSVFLERL